MTRDLSQANQIANSTQFAINDYRRRVTEDMPPPNPAPEPAPLPEHLINVGDVDSETLRRHQRRARRRATAQRPPHAVDGCIRVPQPLSVHTESTYAATTQDVNISSTIVSEAGPSSTSFIPQPHYAFTYPSGPFFQASYPTPPTQLPFSFPSFPSSSHHTPYPTSQFSDFHHTQLPFTSMLGLSQMAPDMQTPQFSSIPSSSTQNFLSTFSTPQLHEVPTPSHLTPPADPNLYAPRDTNVDDSDDDSQSDGAQFMDMSSGRRAHRRHLGLRSRVRVHRPCDT